MQKVKAILGFFVITLISSVPTIFVESKFAPPAEHSTTDRAIVAERISIVDKSGKTKAVLSETGLAIFDSSGKLRVGVGTAPDGSSLVSLYDNGGEAGLTARLSENGDGQLQLAKGRSQVGITLIEGRSGLVILDRNGRPRLSVGADRHGRPGILLNDDLGSRFAVNLSNGKGISLGLLGTDSKAKLLLAISRDQIPSVTLWDRNGILKNHME